MEFRQAWGDTGTRDWEALRMFQLLSSLIANKLISSTLSFSVWEIWLLHSSQVYIKMPVSKRYSLGHLLVAILNYERKNGLVQPESGGLPCAVTGWREEVALYIMAAGGCVGWWW